jgi:transcriptional regulator with XRE-family HTH domain
MARTVPDNGIAGRIQAARRRLGYNREALAFHSGVSWSAITQVEAGRRINLRPTTLAALADALGVSIDYLVSGRPRRAPMLDHRALVYRSDAELVGGAVPFLSEAAQRSEALLVVTTPHNIELLRRQLGAAAGEVKFADRSVWCQSPRTAIAGYRAFIDAALDAGATWVRILAEPPLPSARAPARARTWGHYEALLNLAFRHDPVSVMCSYDSRVVSGEAMRHAGTSHPRLHAGGQLTASADFADPSALVLDG